MLMSQMAAVAAAPAFYAGVVVGACAAAAGFVLALRAGGRG
jgi:hypothetical protein